MKVYIKIRDKGTGRISKKVDLEDIIYKQNEIEFEFGRYGKENYEALPYDDFLFWQNDYDLQIYTD